MLNFPKNKDWVGTYGEKDVCEVIIGPIKFDFNWEYNECIICITGSQYHILAHFVSASARLFSIFLKEIYYFVLL